MASAVNIVLADALATPVNHTFIPLGPQDNWDMIWEDQSRPSPNGYWRIGTRMKRPRTKVAGTTTRIEVVLWEPVLEAIAPASSGLTQPPTVAYTPVMETSFRISDRSTLQERKDLRKMGANLLIDAQIIALVEQFIPAY